MMGTRKAPPDGTITIRDTDKQQQNVTDLSRDAEHANNALSPIFDKEKEQNRLKEAQLIGEIGGQVFDVISTQGQIQATTAAKDALAKGGNLNPTQKEIEASQAYKDAMKDYGIGGTYQKIAQAATAALQGLAGGDMTKALAGASAPYLAQMIKDVAGEDNEAARIGAHAVLGAVLSHLQGNSAAAGGIGALSGELAAIYIKNSLYPNIETKDLTEAQKQVIVNLSSLAAGLSGGIAGDSTGSAVAGAQAGKNAVENNYLSDKDITTFTEKYAQAKTDEERDQLKAELSQLDKDKQHQALATGIPLKEQKAELEKLKRLAASPDCIGQCQELVSYSISELEPVVNNPQLHQDNINKGILAAVIYGLTIDKPVSGGSGVSTLTKEQQQLIRNAEMITTAKGIQNPFPRDLNEKVLWNMVKANPSAGYPLTGLNSDLKFPPSAGFQKMSVNHTLPDGRNIKIHYQYNSFTNKAYDMKVITPQRPGAAYKEKQ